MEWILLIIAAALLTWVHRDGQKQGESKERKRGAERAQEYEEVIADVELEAKQNLPFGERVRAMRERIARRRGDGGLSGDSGK